MHDIDRIVEAIKRLSGQKTKRHGSWDGRPRPISVGPSSQSPTTSGMSTMSTMMYSEAKSPSRSVGLPSESKSPSRSVGLPSQTKSPSRSARHPSKVKSPAASPCAGAEEPKRVEVVTDHDLVLLLEHYIRTSFSMRDDDEFSFDVQKNCEALFRKDYKCSLLNNKTGILSPTYPYHLIYIDKELEVGERNNLDFLERSDVMSKEAGDVLEIIAESASARHHKRFPISVMMFNGKHICRSANPAKPKEISVSEGPHTQDVSGSEASGSDLKSLVSKSSPAKKKDLTIMACNADIALLKAYKISHIIDFTMKRKHSSHLESNSSECYRPNTGRSFWYADLPELQIMQAPYPDAAFFKSYSNKGTGYGLPYEWTKTDLLFNRENNPLCKPNTNQYKVPGVNWRKYMQWDLDDLTKNYLRLLMSVLSIGKNGILLECILGMDRIPLFISLLRISLWADGKIHKSLLPTEIAYLVIAYDWYLFGHRLPDRIKEGEEVLTFFFQALKLIISEDCCIHTCVNSYLAPSLEINSEAAAEETDSHSVTDSVMAVSGSVSRDLDEVQAKTPDANAMFDTLFDESHERQPRDKMTIVTEIVKLLPKEIPMKNRDSPNTALMRSIRGVEITDFTQNQMWNTIEKCLCYTNISPYASTRDVVTWRVMKLKAIRNLLTSHFSLAAGRCLVKVHGMDDTSFSTYANTYSKGRKSFMKYLTNLTISKFTWEELCPEFMIRR